MDGSTKRAGHDFLDSLQKWTRTDCGYAAVKNVASLELDDTMPSFFLAETVKYLYLLFDDDNFIHRRPYIFTTEAHPFLRNPTGGLQKRQQTPLPPLPASASSGQLSGKGTEEDGSGSGGKKAATSMFDLLKLGVNTNPLKRVWGGSDKQQQKIGENHFQKECGRTLWPLDCACGPWGLPRCCLWQLRGPGVQLRRVRARYAAWNHHSASHSGSTGAKAGQHHP